MNINVPVYIQEEDPRHTDFGKSRRLSIRPLFFATPSEQDESLQRATARLTRTLRREFRRLANSARHEELAAYGFNPEIEEKLLEFPMELGKRRFTMRQLFIVVPVFGRRFAWSPNVPEVWIEVARGETLRDRAQEAFTRYYKALERRFGVENVRPDANALSGRAWLSTVEVIIDIPKLHTPPVENIFALLGSVEALEGAEELERVGRSLHALYPDDLAQAIHRDDEVNELTELASAGDLRPVLVVGKRLVGKTAVIHEFVRRRLDRRRSSEKTMHVGVRGSSADLAGEVWLISPQRLISGMSYVGQWEGRLLAILKEAKRKRHTLYFDDLVGLFYSGRTSNSQLSVAYVLKPYIERRDVRVLAEVTPEELRVLQELDRSFVDLFEILRIDEPNEDRTIRTLLGYRRALERQHGSRFHAEVLPTVVDLTRRYVSDAAFPGKAAALLQILASKHKDGEIVREDALQEFSARSGLSVNFLDDRTQLVHADIVKALEREVIGQKTAVAACADAVTIAKARLNDADRPIASFLFLGPTGVGKTQCARSLANYLFGNHEKILRFDMNEFGSYYSVARLTGTFDEPEGLLTSAVRREPFAVVLFDEIEKAHPAVFDLLLGVMGDARLTDARGQLVDFSNTIIILTSNLGAREAAGELGFRQTNQSDASVYRQAAERFFKPEFFNRLTRVVPFERLRREDVQSIARQLIENVFRRDGLVNRGVKLIVEESALNLLVEAGYHPQLGARALKRVLERQVTVPIAAQLSATTPDQPLIIFLREKEGKIAVDVRSLTILGDNAAPLINLELSNSARILDHVEDALDRIERDTEALTHRGEVLIGDSKSALRSQLQNFQFREQMRRVVRMLDRADQRRERQSTGARRTNVNSSPVAKRQLAKIQLPTLDDTILGQDLHALLFELKVSSAPFGEEFEDYLQDLIRETSLLELMAASLKSEVSNTQTLLTISCFDDRGRDASKRLRGLYHALFEREFGCQPIKSEQPHVETLLLEGPLAARIASLEAGTHLIVSSSEGNIPIVVSACETDHAPGSPKLELLPVIRIYSEFESALDLRSRLLARGKLGSAELRAFVLSALSLPPEFSN
ncbi:MAG TPA: AAA family ATPase [Pyrinomonadaceae bacterium]|nr:AAA family ATPase [Pyrinomonadaceae bacterium]